MGKTQITILVPQYVGGEINAYETKLFTRDNSYLYSH